MMKIFVVFASLCSCVVGFLGNDEGFKIVGGQKSPVHYPYQLSLQKFSPSYGFFASKNFTHFCGAIIIGENHLLTAAHCVDKQNLSQVYALAGTSNLKDTSSGSRVPIQSCLIHPLYTKLTFNTTSRHDIALCKVQVPFVFSENVAKIALDKTFVGADVNCTLTGWGSVKRFRWLPIPFYDEIAYPNDLHRGFLLTISNKECKEKQKNIDENHICTSGGKGKGACAG
jgi:secreted trypsin-like serine protease